MIYAGVARRLAAAVVDGVIIGLPRGGLVLLTPFLPDTAKLPVWVLLDVISIVYDVVAHALFGQTLGKALMRIRVVAVDGEPISWGRALLRSFPVMCLSLVAIAAMVMLQVTYTMDGTPLETELLDVMESTSTASWVWAVCDGAFLISNERRRTLSDYLAGTVVAIVARGAAAVGTDTDEVAFEARFKGPEPVYDEGEDDRDDDAPLAVLAPSGVFACPECVRLTNFGASECRGCGERFRYRKGQVFRDPD